MKKFTTGQCGYVQVSPPDFTAQSGVINFIISFEEALKLSLALQARLLQINAENRSTIDGKRQAVNLCVYPLQKRIASNKGAIPRKLKY